MAQHTTVLARQLALADHAVCIVSWSHQYPKRPNPGRQTVKEAEFEPFDQTERVLAWNRPGTWVRAGRRLSYFDAVIFADVTVIQVPPYWTMIRLPRRKPLFKAVICHNVLPHEARPGDRFLTTRLLDAVDRIVVHSPAEAEESHGQSPSAGW